MILIVILLYFIKSNEDYIEEDSETNLNNELNYINIKNYDFMFCKKCSSYMSSEMELCDLWSEDFEYLIDLIKNKDITIDFSEKEG